MIKSWLAHPLTRGMNIDDPRTTLLRRQIIQEKSFLRQIYQEWYGAIAAALPAGEEPVLELGSGAGFLSDFIPGLITSEIFYCPSVRVVLDGSRLSFSDGVLRGIVMTRATPLAAASALLHGGRAVCAAWRSDRHDRAMGVVMVKADL